MKLKYLLDLLRIPLYIEIRIGNEKIGIFKTDTTKMFEFEDEIIDNWFIYSDGSRMVIDLKEIEEWEIVIGGKIKSEEYRKNIHYC